MPRFFTDKSAVDEAASRVTITGDDAHHIARSLRMAEGETVTVCDGAGLDLLCRLDTIRDTEVIATVLSSSRCEAEPPYKISVFQALVKGDRMDTVVQKTVEFGAAEIIPFEARRCIMKLSDSEGNKEKRRARIAFEAAKQCGRGIIPEVKPAVSFDTMLKEAAKADIALFCYEDEKTLSVGSLLKDAAVPLSVAVIVGPEGGFSPEEAEAARGAGINVVSLGRRILRTESAAAFVLAVLSGRYEL